MGIEPTRPAWKAGTLPLSYTRLRERNTKRHHCRPCARGRAEEEAPAPSRPGPFPHTLDAPAPVYTKIPDKQNWSGGQDLNLQPLPPKGNALPGCATTRSRKIIVSPAVETVKWSAGRCYGTVILSPCKRNEKMSPHEGRNFLAWGYGQPTRHPCKLL